MNFTLYIQEWKMQCRRRQCPASSTEKNDFKLQTPIDMHQEEIELKPSAKEVMDHIVPNYVIGFIYGALVEAFASEHNARMMAMEGATNSAKQMFKDWQLNITEQTGCDHAGDYGGYCRSEVAEEKEEIKSE